MLAKRLVAVFMAAVLVAALCPAAAFAQLRSASIQSDDPPWGLSSYSVTLSRYSEPAVVWLVDFDEDYYEDYPEVYSDDPDVAEAYGIYEEDGRFYFEIEKVGVGETYVIVEDEDGDWLEVEVSCEPAPLTLCNYWTGASLAAGYTFSKATKEYSDLAIRCGYEEGYVSDCPLAGAESSDPSVASVSFWDSSTSGPEHVVVTPRKPGTATVTCRDNLGRTESVQVVVQKAFFKANTSYLLRAWSNYGEKKVQIYNAPANAKITVKIGREKHAKRTNAKGEVAIKLKKAYKLNTKFKVSVKSKYVSLTKKFKTVSNTSGWFAWAHYSNQYNSRCTDYNRWGRQVHIEFSNVHKGDRFILSGKKEKHKVKFPESAKGRAYIVYMNKALYTYGTLRLTVKNKYGQTLSTRTFNP